MSWNKITECVPNFSEGRNLEKIDRIVAPFRSKAGVKLLDYSNDEDHNRLVVILVGEPETLCEAVVGAVGAVVRLIDLNQHTGQHPRMGAVDVIPFIPIKNTSMEGTAELSKKVATKVAELYNLPVSLYEESATALYRENLASVRKGEFEGMAEKIKLPEWQPDFGPAERHSTAGTVVTGARMPLVACNINLSTDNMGIAIRIAKNVRHTNGGLRYIKAMGVEPKERNITQISINVADYTRTTLYRALGLVRIEARRYDVIIVGSEIIGLVPMEALVDTASHYLGFENFTVQQALEARIMEWPIKK